MRFTHHKDVVSLVIGFFETLPNQIGQPVTENSNVRVRIDFGDLRLRLGRRQARPGLGLGPPRAPGLHIRPRAARWWCVGARPARLILVRSARGAYPGARGKYCCCGYCCGLKPGNNQPNCATAFPPSGPIRRAKARMRLAMRSSIKPSPRHQRGSPAPLKPVVTGKVPASDGRLREIGPIVTLEDGASKAAWPTNSPSDCFCTAKR